MEKDHIVAIAYEEPIGVIGMDDGLIDIIEYDIGYQQ